MVATVDKKSKRQLARIEERERAGTELGQPGADQFKELRAADGPVETHTLAALSTAHLKPETAIALEKSRGYPYGPLVSVFEEGFFVSCLVGSPAEHADLEAVRQWARERGYGYVLLDRDADEVDGLPTYEW